MQLTLMPLSDRRAQTEAVLAEYEAEAAAAFGPFVRNLVEPLRRALRSRAVEGYALMAGRVPVAAICYARYSRLVRVTLLHCCEAWRGQGHEARLLSLVLSDVGADPVRDDLRSEARSTIVCEAMVVSHPDPDQLFREHGFHVIGREIMAVKLGPAVLFPRSSPPHFELRRSEVVFRLRGWQRGDVNTAGEVLRRANRGSLDGRIYPELVDPQLSERAVQSIVAGSFGRFDHRGSSCLVALPESRCAGVAMCTWSSREAAFLAEIAVLPQWQGMGLGQALLDRTIARLAAAGCRQLFLGVTTANSAARRMYASRGFVRLRSFGSYHRPAGGNS